MIENECCICLNVIEDYNIFNLECCNQMVHHDCIVNWINTNINSKLSDYNKCILCKSYNKTIDDYYNDLIISRRMNTYIDLDNSNSDILYIVTPENRITQIRQNDEIPSQNCKHCSYIFSITSIFILIYIIIVST